MGNTNRRLTGDIAPIPAAKTKIAAPLVQAVEPIKGDWSQNNNWAFTYDKNKAGWPLVNTPATIVSVAQCPVFRGPPRIRGVLLSRDDFYIGASVPGMGTLGIQARITYGSGGNSQQFLVDWGATTVVNLPASNIVVEAIVTGSNDDGFGNLVFGSILSANFSNELIPKVGYTTLSESWNTAVTIEVPPFAVGFTVSNDPGGAPGISAQAFSTADSANPLATYYDVFLQSNVGQINWLPTGSAYLAAGGPVTTTINWILSV